MIPPQPNQWNVVFQTSVEPLLTGIHCGNIESVLAGSALDLLSITVKSEHSTVTLALKSLTITNSQENQQCFHGAKRALQKL